MENPLARQGGYYTEAVVRPGSHPPEPVWVGYPEQLPPMQPGRAPFTGILDLLRILRRRKGLLIIAAFLGGLAGFLLTLPQTPVYQSTSRVEIQVFNDILGNRRQTDPTIETSDLLTDIQTQIKIMQSVTLLEQVVAKLRLDERPDALEPPGRIAAWRRALGLRTEASPAELRAQAVSMAAANLKVTSLKGTRIVELACDSTDPKLAADFLNTLSGRFIEQSMESRYNSAQNTSKWLKIQLEDMKIQLEKSEDELQDLARSTGLIFTSEKESVAEQRLRQLNDELAKAQAERISRQSRYQTMKSRTAEALPEVLDDPSLRESATRLADLRRQLAELDTAMTASHPRVRALQAQAAEVQKDFETNRGNILKRIENELETARGREKLLAEQYLIQSRLVTEQASRGIQYGIQKREVDAYRARYEDMLAQVREYEINSTIRASNVIVIDPAKAPLLPYKPSLPRYCLLGLFLGLGSGIGLVFIMNQADRTLQQPGDMPACVDLPELGVIPAARTDPSLREALKHRPAHALKAADEGKSLATLVEETKTLISQPDTPAANTAGADTDAGDDGHGSEPMQKCVALATLQRKHSILAEAYRATLASILFTGNNGTRPRVMLITSPSPEEGKTSSVTNLGIALAEINRRVVLIDADLRRPRLHELLDVANTRGLSDLLHERNSIEEYPLEALAAETRVPNLYVLPSGPRALSIANLLYSPRMAELIARFRREFDTVLIDTPPMLQISDARVLGALVDGVILVVRAGLTRRDSALAAVRRFAEDGTNVIGTILNYWDPKKSPQYGYYSKYYYGGKYSYYYSSENRDSK